MNFGDAVASVFHNYANFFGRARRSEYWYWVLFTVFVSYIVSQFFGDSLLGSIVGGLIDLFFFIPALAVTVRRMHDTGKSGWFLLFNLIPLFGSIIVFVRLCRDSAGDNQYGPSPKYPGNYR